MPSYRVQIVVIAMLATGRAHAQDALRGKRLYLDAARIVGSGVSCVDCHGGLPGGLFGISRAANDPARVENAIDSIPQMAPLRGRLTGVDLADLAAYIGNPAVASPQVQVTTWLPDSEAGPADRIDFGEIEVDAASAVTTLQITNTGQLAFAITSAPEVTGADASEFLLESSDCWANSLVVPMRSCSFELRFRPVGAVGARTARFSVVHDWVHGSAAVALLGLAVPPASPPPPSPGCSSSNGNTAWPLLGLFAWLPWSRSGKRPRSRSRESSGMPPLSSRS